MNHGAGNCSCSQLLYEMKLKELEKEVGRLSTNLYETQQTVKVRACSSPFIILSHLLPCLSHLFPFFLVGHNPSFYASMYLMHQEQELKMKMSHERVTERDSQLQRCQDLMVKVRLCLRFHKCEN